ncbi:MAG: Gfo/Idh/MocA family oxidoreductase [Chloroflexia bacterium]|nr:Gfo/Idh/MocA family oxidoreductase [Chloroflexia bacterium]
MEPIRVGVVGCGQIAQIMHLPYLTELPQFRVTAVCDLSTAVVEAVGERFGVPVRCRDYADLVSRDDVDAVAVLTIEHAGVAVAAAAAGKHLFIEKPIGFSLAEADRIIAAVARAGVTAMIGYMKRYDPGYEYGAARMQAMDDVRLIRVHDFAVDFSAHLPLFTLVTADDLPPALLAESQAAIEATRRAALGAEHAHLSELYSTLLMLASHDLAILRGAFGAPAGVRYSDAISPTELLSVLDYGEGRRCVFEAGVRAQYLWWDEQMTAYGAREIVEITFPNPYVPYAPTVVTIRENEAGSPVRKEIPVSHQEAFRREWLHFAECVRSGSPPRTSLADARADVALAIDMIRAIPVADRAGAGH